MILARLFLFVVLALAPASAMAETIQFDALNDFASILGPQVEGSFTYDQVGSGIWRYTNLTGSPASALTSGFPNFPSPGDTFDFHLISLGLFKLTSFDFAMSTLDSSSDTVSFIPKNGGVEGAALCSGINSNTTGFVTNSACSPSISMDHLLIRITAFGAQPIAFDNIVLDTVAAPEPASLLLLGAGLVGVVARTRKSKA